MSTTPLRKLTSDLIATAPPALLSQALTLALKQEGTYDSTDPARLLARLIEEAFAGQYRPTVEQIDKVRAAIGATILLSRPLPKDFDVCSFYTPTSATDRSCYTCGGESEQHIAGSDAPKETP